MNEIVVTCEIKENNLEIIWKLFQGLISHVATNGGFTRNKTLKNNFKIISATERVVKLFQQH